MASSDFDNVPYRLGPTLVLDCYYNNDYRFNSTLWCRYVTTGAGAQQITVKQEKLQGVVDRQTVRFGTVHCTNNKCVANFSSFSIRCNAEIE